MEEEIIEKTSESTTEKKTKIKTSESKVDEEKINPKPSINEEKKKVN